MSGLMLIAIVICFVLSMAAFIVAYEIKARVNNLSKDVNGKLFTFEQILNLQDSLTQEHHMEIPDLNKRINVSLSKIKKLSKKNKEVYKYLQSFSECMSSIVDKLKRDRSSDVSILKCELMAHIDILKSSLYETQKLIHDSVKEEMSHDIEDKIEDINKAIEECSEDSICDLLSEYQDLLFEKADKLI